MRRFSSCFVLALVATWAWCPAGQAQFRLEADRLYQTTDFGIAQFSADLQPTGVAAPAQIAGSYGMVGGAVSPDGQSYLVCGYLSGGGGLNQGARLFELNAQGQYVRNLPLTNIGLNRASHIVFDRSDRMYLGSPAGLHEYGTNLSGGGVVPVAFGRVAGIAVDADNRLFVADQENDRIVVLDETRRQVLQTFPTGRVPMGIDFAPDGSLYYTDTPFRTASEYLGRLVRLDPATGEQQVIFDRLRTAVDVEFVSDGSFYLATAYGGQITHYSAALQPLDTIVTGTAGDVINFVERHEIPEPAGLALVASACALFWGRRRSPLRAA